MLYDGRKQEPGVKIGMKISRKTIIGIGTLLLGLVLCGCGKASSDPTTETIAPTTPVEKGGYALTVNPATVTVLAEDAYKQIRYVSADGSNTIDFYASPGEMILVDTTNGVKRYYT